MNIEKQLFNCWLSNITNMLYTRIIDTIFRFSLLAITCNIFSFKHDCFGKHFSDSINIKNIDATNLNINHCRKASKLPTN